MSAVPEVQSVPGTTAARRDVVNVLRFLDMDAVQQANSGHPGMPTGMAEIAEVLWRRHLRARRDHSHGLRNLAGR